MQGAALRPDTGQLYTVEHGAQGGDELNHPEKGKNYGWPIITYGIDYDGSKIGEGSEKPGMEPAVYYWKPSIATSGLAFYTGDLFPGWKGNAFVGGLAGQHIERLVLDGDNVVAAEKLLVDREKRIRDIRQGPDGALWVLTDEDDGEILRITPAPVRRTEAPLIVIKCPAPAAGVVSSWKVRKGQADAQNQAHPRSRA